MALVLAVSAFRAYLQLAVDAEEVVHGRPRARAVVLPGASGEKIVAAERAHPARDRVGHDGTRARVSETEEGRQTRDGGDTAETRGAMAVFARGRY